MGERIITILSFFFAVRDNSPAHRKCGPDRPPELIRLQRRLLGAWHDGRVPGAPDEVRNCCGSRLDTSPGRAGQPELITVTRRSEELASRRPRTVPRIRSMAEDKAAVQPTTFRVHAVGIIRCRPAMRAARTLPPPPDRNLSMPNMLKNPFSCPREPRPLPVGRYWQMPARPRCTHGTGRETEIAAGCPCKAAPAASGPPFASKRGMPRADHPDPMSVAYRLWARVLGERDH